MRAGKVQNLYPSEHEGDGCSRDNEGDRLFRHDILHCLEMEAKPAKLTGTYISVKWGRKVSRRHTECGVERDAVEI